MKIEVTAEDILKGKRIGDEEVQASTSCPLALACRRAFGGVVSVSGNTIRLHEGKNAASRVWMRIFLPLAAYDFVVAFDSNGRKAVVPFSFEVEA